LDDLRRPRNLFSFAQLIAGAVEKLRHKMVIPSWVCPGQVRGAGYEAGDAGAGPVMYNSPDTRRVDCTASEVGWKLLL
jgi:hypothetical protein